MAELEPDKQGKPIYVRLGMTKGALIAFLIVYLATIVGFWRLEDIASDQKKLIRSNQTQVALVKKQAAENRAALREVCRQTRVIEGLVNSTIILFQYEIYSGILPPRALSAYNDILAAFKGYSGILSERPACREVLNP